MDMEQSAPDICDHILEARLRDLEGRMEKTRVLEDLRRKLRAYQEGCWQFGYAMCALELR